MTGLSWRWLRRSRADRRLDKTAQATDPTQRSSPVPDDQGLVRSVDWLAQRGRTDEAFRALAAQALQGWDVVRPLVGMLVGLERVEDAVALLLGDRIDRDAALCERLSQMLARDQIDDAVWLARLESSEPDDWDRLYVAKLLLKHHRVAEALDLLQTLADDVADDSDIEQQVAALLAEHRHSGDR
jgi:hypothetical protein